MSSIAHETVPFLTDDVCINSLQMSVAFSGAFPLMLHTYTYTPMHTRMHSHTHTRARAQSISIILAFMTTHQGSTHLNKYNFESHCLMLLNCSTNTVTTCYSAINMPIMVIHLPE